ncbi:PfkB family carbohydrate kinase, partial [Kineococcus glutinatus]|uniref:PfkB family carbohydrate kinase n=1 Tax=Kineococcus glutinatus TaxID=1070872 RepID=UPI0031EB403E
VVVDGSTDDEEVRADALRTATDVRADSHEAQLLVGRELAGVDAVRRAAADLVAAGPRLVVLSAGADGDVAAWDGGSVIVPHPDVPPADPTGGGDTFTAALAVAVLRRDGPEEVVRWVAAASTLTVQHLGGRPDLGRGAVDGRLARGG